MGHDLVIQRALAQSERLTILVVTNITDWPSGAERTACVREAYPQAEVLEVTDLCTDDSDMRSSFLWAEYALDVLDGRIIDAVFSSEAYGDFWAANIELLQNSSCRSIVVDPLRTLVPVSGTKIRSDPYTYWQYIHPKMRHFYLTRVLVVGAESTGKTTLVQNLSNAFGTRYVPEYGRYYVEAKGGLEQTDHRIIFAEILNRTPKIAKEAEEKANKVVFWDTDLYTTYLWYGLWQPERKNDELHQAIEYASAVPLFDLVLVSSHEGTDWVDDGMRDQKDTRAWFTEQFYGNENYFTRPFLLEGSWEERFSAAEQLVKDVMQKRKQDF